MGACMVWSVCLLDEDGSGVTGRVDLLSLGAIVAPLNVDDIGMSRDTGRKLLGELQHAIVVLQETALRVQARQQAAASPGVEIKDYRIRNVQTLFGTVSLRAPRIIDHGQIENVLPISCGARSTREFDDLRSKLSAWMSYRVAMDLLGEMYPVKDGKSAQTAMRQVAIAAKRLEDLPAACAPFQDDPIALPLDTTFVRGTEPEASHGLEILVGAVSQGSDPIHYFACPFTRKEDCIRLGKAALATRSSGEIEAFSDNARSVRAMAKSIGAPAKPISDWFHLSMRIQHAICVADALEATTESVDRANKAVRKELRSMRTELWRGNVPAVAQALKEIRPHLQTFSDEPHSPIRIKRVKKLRSVMRKLARYVQNPDARIVDYCSRKIAGKRLGTSLVEGGAEFIVNARMAKSQHMRWTTQGAYNLLQVRAADINQRLLNAKLAA